MENKIKKITAENEREDTAIAIHNQLIKLKNTINFSKFLFVAALRTIKQQEFWKEMNCESFEMYICQPDIDIGLTPETVKKYIKIIDDLIVKGLEEEEMKDITINKLGMIRNAENPKKYLVDASVLGYSDLMIKIYEKEKGIDIEKKREEKAIDKADTDIGCPHWKKCKCELGAF